MLVRILAVNTSLPMGIAPARMLPSPNLMLKFAGLAARIQQVANGYLK